MTWLQRYDVRHYVRNSIWIWPFLSMVAAIVAVRLLQERTQPRRPSLRPENRPTCSPSGVLIYGTKQHPYCIPSRGGNLAGYGDALEVLRSSKPLAASHTRLRPAVVIRQRLPERRIGFGNSFSSRTGIRQLDQPRSRREPSNSQRSSTKCISLSWRATAGLQPASETDELPSLRGGCQLRQPSIPCYPVI